MTRVDLINLSTAIRHYILTATTAASSGHPSSSLSAVELMVGLMFGGIFRADLRHPEYVNNDRLIFSKGHAAPLLYSLYAAAGVLSIKQLLKLRTFNSSLEGHPMPRWPYVDIPTGSLGQGLSAGVGMALAAKHDRLSYRTYVLLGDSEMSEGQVWEAVQIAGHRKLDNLTAVLDVNRLGQSGATMIGHDAERYAKRVRSFGWNALVVDGHALGPILSAYHRAMNVKSRPTMIIANTIKGRGVPLMENKNGWHGKSLNPDQLNKALKRLSSAKNAIGRVLSPKRISIKSDRIKTATQPKYDQHQNMSPRQAFGRGLVRLAQKFPRMVVLDGEVMNSTYTEYFADAYPNRFFQGYIAEQNMVTMATGMASRGLLPVSATFAAFFTRAFDQLRMAQYAGYHQVFAGTHVGVSIGQDGPSQMGLEDIAMFRSIGATVLYPADAWAAERLLDVALRGKGMIYLRLTRAAGPQLYNAHTTFHVGGSHTLKRSQRDRATIVTAGITVWESLRAAEILAKQKVAVRVIDAYSLASIDVAALRRAARETKHIITVEDHRPAGGLGEAVRSALGQFAGTVMSLAVNKTPRSGKPEELFQFEEIDAAAIVRAVKKILS